MYSFPYSLYSQSLNQDVLFVTKKKKKTTDFSKVLGYKISMQNLITFLYINNKQSGNQNFKHNTIYNHSKRKKKILRCKFNKNVYRIYMLI